MAHPGSRCPGHGAHRLIVALVALGFDDVHRIYNGTNDTVITIHTYGCDLVVDPESINLPIAS